MRNPLLYVTIILLCIGYNVNAQNNQKDIFENVINQVSEDSIISYISSLQNFGTRYTLSENRKEVALWIKSKFESFGYTNVQLDSFEFPRNDSIYWQYNVICRSENPYNLDRYSLLGAHHDAITYENPYDSAPGADDNASGVAGVLETARVLKMYADLEYPVYFATWAAEEFGLHGSRAYTQKYALLNDLPELYFNLDMIANSEGDNFFVKYESSSVFDELRPIAEQYSNLNIIDVGTTGNSDHSNFRGAGVPIMYFAEYYFSDVYHSEADVLDNCETDFAKEVTKATAFLMYYTNKINPAVNIQSIINAGDGTSLMAKWEAQDDAVKYLINIQINGSIYTTIETTADSLMVTDLPENELVKFIIQSIDSENLTGLSSNASLQLSSIPPPLNVVADMDYQNIEFSWDTFLPLDCETAIFERKENDEWIEVSDADAFLGSISIPSHPTGIWEYRAVLTDTDNNQSVSESFYVYSTSKIEDIMVVVGSLGGYGNVTYSQVESFYDSILPNKPKHILYEPPSGKLIPTVLNMEALIWTSLLPFGSFEEYYDLFDKFLDKGGKMIIAGKDVHKVIDSDNLTNADLDESLMTSRFGLHKAIQVDNARLFKVEHNGGTYATINPDKVPTSMIEGLIDFVAFEPNESGEQIASYQSGFDSFPENALDGEAIAIKVENDSTNSIVLGIPLYYLKTTEAKNLLYTLLNEELEVGIQSEMYSTTNIDIYPNPANEWISIQSNSEKPIEAIISLFDIQGRTILSTKRNLGTGEAQTINTSTLDPGVYIMEVQHERTEYIKLMIK